MEIVFNDDVNFNSKVTLKSDDLEKVQKEIDALKNSQNYTNSLEKVKSVGVTFRVVYNM